MAANSGPKYFSARKSRRFRKEKAPTQVIICPSSRMIYSALCQTKTLGRNSSTLEFQVLHRRLRRVYLSHHFDHFSSGSPFASILVTFCYFPLLWMFFQDLRIYRPLLSVPTLFTRPASMRGLRRSKAPCLEIPRTFQTSRGAQATFRTKQLQQLLLLGAKDELPHPLGSG